MTPIPLTVTSAPAGPLSPNYVDPNSLENKDQITNTKIPQGYNANRGVILTPDGLSVPLETAFGITNEKSETSRPALMPLFRTRYVQLPLPQAFLGGDYEELRNNLSPELQVALSYDETLNFRERDPDLLALDASLHFEAMRRGIFDLLKNPPVDTERAAASQANEQNITQEVTQRTLILTNHLIDQLEGYLQTMGPNDPGYDLFLTTLNQMKEAVNLLRKK